MDTYISLALSYLLLLYILLNCNYIGYVSMVTCYSVSICNLVTAIT
jgi:hypothetical protein